MDSWHSYPKIYALGHRAITDLFSDPVVIEEKIDGSQFSFGRFGEELRVRSKGVVMNIDAPENMFLEAVCVVKLMAKDLHDGWTYRAEYLKSPKHNTLAYERIPKNHLIVFDINTAEEKYLSYEEKKAEAERLDLECVTRFENTPDPKDLLNLLENTSSLGGPKIEGFVVKNYSRFGKDGKVLMGKYVSESFKESHGNDWGIRNPGQGDIIPLIVEKFKTEARWQKSVNHLKEAGKLEGSPRDIGNLIKEAQKDLLDECSNEIKDVLLGWAQDKILRGIICGLPEWYKKQLFESQFTEKV